MWESCLGNGLGAVALRVAEHDLGAALVGPGRAGSGAPGAPSRRRTRAEGRPSRRRATAVRDWIPLQAKGISWSLALAQPGFGWHGRDGEIEEDLVDPDVAQRALRRWSRASRAETSSFSPGRSGRSLTASAEEALDGDASGRWVVGDVWGVMNSALLAHA